MYNMSDVRWTQGGCEWEAASDVYEQVAHANNSSAHSSLRCCRATPGKVLATWIGTLQPSR